MGNGKDTDGWNSRSKGHKQGTWGVPQGSLWLLATLHRVCRVNQKLCEREQRPEARAAGGDVRLSAGLGYGDAGCGDRVVSG